MKNFFNKLGKKKTFIILSAGGLVFIIVVFFIILIGFGFYNIYNNKKCEDTTEDEITNCNTTSGTSISETASETGCYYKNKLYSDGETFQDEDEYLSCWCTGENVACSSDLTYFSNTLVPYETKDSYNKYYMEDYDLSITLPEECSLVANYITVKYGDSFNEYFKHPYKDGEIIQFSSYSVTECQYSFALYDTYTILTGFDWCITAGMENYECHSEEYIFTINNASIQCSGDKVIEKGTSLNSTEILEAFYCPKDFDKTTPAGEKSNVKGVLIFALETLSDDQIRSEEFRSILESIE